MKSAYPFFRMLRLPNLAIVFLSLFLPYYMVLRPAIAEAGGLPNLSREAFILLAVATVLTSFAGYFINDIFDEKIDAVNRPERLFIGKYLPRRAAIFIYVILLVSVLWLAQRLGIRYFPERRMEVLALFGGVSVALFLYARFLKCTPVLGNIWVAILCALVPVVALQMELRPLHILSLTAPETAQRTLLIYWNFVVFAFLTNFFREMVKDIEDFGGDAACGCRTFPVIRGIRVARRVAGLVGAILFFVLILLTYFWFQTGAPMWKIGCAVLFLLLPCGFAVFKTWGGEVKKDFSQASLAIKILMLAGLVLLSF